MTRKLAASNMESQSLSGFLESDVKNTYRGTLKSTACSFVWNPHTSTSPFPSPLHQYKLWVETTTAFHQDLFIIGSFTLHKLGHIIDIFSDWSIALVQTARKWNYGTLLPLYLLADIVIIGGAWLLPQKSSIPPELYCRFIQTLWLSDSSKTFLSHNK